MDRIIPVYKCTGTTRSIRIDISMPYPTYEEMGDGELNDRVKAQGREIAEVLINNVPAPVFEEVRVILQYYLEHGEFPPKPALLV